jgi:hypothetical protein
VPEDLRIPGYPQERLWCFALIEGWRELIGRPIPEIAFAQWERMSGAIEAARPLVPADRWVDARLEDLRAKPRETLADICEGIHVPFEERLGRALEQLNRKPAEATSAPRDGKWRHENEAEIRELLPRIAAASPRLGYHVDPETGEAQPA